MATMEAVDFSVDRYSIQAGECVTFRWNVQGIQAIYFYPEGERWQDNGVVGEGSRLECPTETTTYYLRIVKTDNSTIYREITIEVQPTTVPIEPPGPTPIGPPGPVPIEPPGPTPIEPPGPVPIEPPGPTPIETDKPVITEWTVTPDRIPVGGCVQMRWSTAGNTSWVKIVRSEQVIVKNAPLQGSQEDCPPAAGTYNYRIVAYNPEEKHVNADCTVTVG